MKTINNNNETKAAGLVNEYYTIFVSKTGKHDHTAFLWVETKDAETYRRALADVEPRGYKVSKIYKPTDVLTAPDFTKCVNTPAEKKAPAKNMKLSPVFEQAAEKVSAFVNKYGEAKVKAYMQQVYDAHEWQNYEVRISNDIVKYYAVGVATVGEWIDKYNANDSHVTTLCVAVMKAVGLLPFNPDKPADAAPVDECDEVKKWAAESVAEVYDDGEFNHAVNEYGETLHNKVTGEILKAPATAPTRPGYKANARVKNMAVSFADNGGEVKKVTRRGVELYEVHRPTGTQILLLTAEDFAETFSPKADKIRRLSAESLAVLTSSEIVRYKSATIAEAEKLHAFGLYAEAVAVSEQTGRLSNEQTRRQIARDESIPEGVGVTFADGETWAGVVFGFSVYDDLMKAFQVDDFNYFATVGEAVNYCRNEYPRTPFEVYAIRRADALNMIEGATLRTVYARHKVGRRFEEKESPFVIVPANVATLYEEYTADELAAFLTDDKQHAETLAHCLTRYELAVLVDETNNDKPTSPADNNGEAVAPVGDFCPLTGQYLTGDGQHLTPAEVKKIAKDEKAKKARKYAEKLSNTPAETLAGLFGNSDRVAILANAYDLTDGEARELLADVQKAPTTGEKVAEGATTPADKSEAVTSDEKAPNGDELSREALAVIEKIEKSPRRVCLFDTFAELYEVKTKAEADGLHKWQALTACGVYREGRDTLATIARMITGDDEAEAPASSCYSQSEKLGESGSQKSPLYSVAEKVGKVANAAAFFLLSLTIGTSHEAAEIVTNDPAAVFAQVAEAGETLTAFALEEIPTPDELPAADVPALL